MCERYIPNNDFDKYDEPRLHMERLMKAHLIEFDLSIRILIPLEKAGIRKLGDLVRHTPEEIRNIPLIGKTSFDKIMKLLERLDLPLRKE